MHGLLLHICYFHNIGAASVNEMQKIYTVMTLSFRTDRSGQTVQTQIRLLLEEQSDQGLHCLLFHLLFSKKYTKVWPFSLNFRYITAKFSGVRRFRTLWYEPCLETVQLQKLLSLHHPLETTFLHITLF